MTSSVFNDFRYVPQKAAVNTQHTPIEMNEVIPASSVAGQQKDTVELSESPKKKKGIVKTVKSVIANIKKFFSSVGEYGKGTLKGIRDAAITGSVIYTAGSIFNHFKAKSAEGAKLIHNKPLAIGVAVLAFAANIWNASLNATEKQSDIDHRWTGHQK